MTMRKIVVFLFILFLSTGIQSQDITTMWPYLYSEFSDGTVYFSNKQTLSAPLNVHLLKSSLHYLDQNEIKEVTTSDIVLVLIKTDTYYVRNNQLMRVLEGDSTGFIAELVLADFNAIHESGGAYGSSSNVQATRKLSSLEVGGINITNLMELKSNKDNGSLLPLKKQYFIVTIDTVYPANRRSIESQLPEDKRKEFRQFVKTNKINWRHPDTLAPLINFLSN
jgi:hypothetical protein